MPRVTLKRIFTVVLVVLVFKFLADFSRKVSIEDLQNLKNLRIDIEINTQAKSSVNQDSVAQRPSVDSSPVSHEQNKLKSTPVFELPAVPPEVILSNHEIISVRDSFKDLLLWQLKSYPKFTCPSFEQLTSIPASCSTFTPKHHTSKSAYFIPIHPSIRPGPSTQTSAFRHIVLTSIYLQRSIITTFFTKHQRTDTSADRSDIENNRVPFGARIDLESLCQFIHIDSDYNLNDHFLKNLKQQDAYDTNLIVHGKEGKRKHMQKGKIMTNKDLDDPKIKLERDYVQFYTNLPNSEARHFEDDGREHLRFYGQSWDMRVDEDHYMHVSNLFGKDRLGNTEKYPIIGIASAHMWIYNISSIIDAGGAYRNINPIEANGHAPEFTDEEAYKIFHNDVPIVRDLYKYTGHPIFIKNLVRDFIKEHLDPEFDPENFLAANFIGMHWRYNFADFIPINKYVESKEDQNSNAFLQNFAGELLATPDHPFWKRGVKHINSMMKSMMETLVEPNGFITKFLGHLEQNLAKSPSIKGINLAKNSDSAQDNEIIHIYIASPGNVAEIFKNQIKFTDPVNKILVHNSQKYKILFSEVAQIYLEKLKPSCPILNQHFDEIFSTFEKELMIQSFGFYRARPSNWSFNVQGARYSKYDRLIFDRTVYDIFLNRF